MKTNSLTSPWTPAVDKAAWRQIAAATLVLGLALAWLDRRQDRWGTTGSIDRLLSPSAADATAQLHDRYGDIPLSFEANQGQADQSFGFIARGAGYMLGVAPTEAVFLLRSADANPSAIGNRQSQVLRMRLAGANPEAKAEGVNKLAGKANYFIGNDPTQWRRDVPTFGSVRYREVYPGIDVVHYGNQRRLEYDFIVAPQSDPRVIALEFPGVTSLTIESATGDLLIEVGGQVVRQHKPVAYQELVGGRREVESRYVIRDGGFVGFDLGDYDARALLVIDPVLTYSTYLGGNNSDYGQGIAVDSAGNAYVTGLTYSPNFPTVNAPQNAFGGSIDIFVAKLNAEGTALIYSTYLGGSAGEFISRIAVDSAGNAIVVGNTASTNFPVANALQPTYRGGVADGFVTKLNAAGSGFIYSTYLGGNDGDGIGDVAVDKDGNAYVAGSTTSPDFPTANALQASLKNDGGSPAKADVFVTKINAAGTAFVYSTYLGGFGNDGATGIAVDSNGNAITAGITSSTDFPTANPFQSSNHGAGESFVAKLNSAGSALVYSTYLGGSDTIAGSANDGADSVEDVAVDAAGNAFVTGSTSSTDFPLVKPLQGSLGGGQSGDAFVTKFDPAGAVLYSTYLGGSGGEIGNGIAADASGNAYVIGKTVSTNFPTANPIQATYGGTGNGGDVFVAQLNPAGSAFVFSTYLGGTGGDVGKGIAVDSAGAVYLTGNTSSNFPTVNPLQAASGGGQDDAFIAKIRGSSSNGVAEKTLANVSTRLPVFAGENVLIGGVIVVGQAPKRVIIRAIGPSLGAAGVSGALEDPTLELFQGSTSLAFNNDWRESQETEIVATGVAPSDNREAAIVRTLEPGAYTAIVRGNGSSTGIGLVDGYDLEQRPDSKLGNIATRGFVSTGDNVLIGGFIVGPNTRVAVRAIGPSLSAAGISGPLQDPTLELVDAQGNVVRANDDWKGTQQAEIEATGLQPSDDRESTLIATLTAASYTAVVRGKGGATGVAVVEVYNLP